MAHGQLENSLPVKGIVVETTELVTGEALLYLDERDEPLEEGRSCHTANSTCYSRTNLRQSHRRLTGWNEGAEGLEGKEAGGWKSGRRERKEITSRKIRAGRFFDVREAVASSTSSFLLFSSSVIPAVGPSYKLLVLTDKGLLWRIFVADRLRHSPANGTRIVHANPATVESCTRKHRGLSRGNNLHRSRA